MSGVTVEYPLFTRVRRNAREQADATRARVPAKRITGVCAWTGWPEEYASADGIRAGTWLEWQTAGMRHRLTAKSKVERLVQQTSKVDAPPQSSEAETSMA
jgi:hypothetical protein